KQIIEQAVCEQVIFREFKDNILVPDDQAKKFYEIGLIEDEDVRKKEKKLHVLLTDSKAPLIQDPEAKDVAAELARFLVPSPFYKPAMLRVSHILFYTR